MKKAILIILVSVTTISVSSQETEEVFEGTVTFVTANNVYVRFASTEEIEIGDSLQFGNADCLRVTQKSTTSVVSTPINDCVVTTGDVITFTFRRNSEEPDTPRDPIVEDEEVPLTNVDENTTYKETESLYRENIRGRVSIGSYNTFSNLRDNRDRFQARFSLTANHIGDSKFSTDTYIAYRGLLSTPEDYTGRTSLFNVYNLNMRFDATENLSVTAGRKINPKATSVGANDGLIVENYFGNFYTGGMAGFRPDFFDYGFNADLFQYGGYAGIETNAADFYSQTTLGAMEQTNNGSTDRRYLFFQHNSTIASNLNLFSSMELDIFGREGNTSRLTNLYLSARYRFSRAVNAAISYDSRKRIIYYQTFQTEIEQILDDDLARQGFRLRLNVRPAKIVWLGASYSNRFQSDQQNKSDNIYVYGTLSRIPGIGGRFNISYNHNTSNYLTGAIVSVRYSRDIVENKLYGDVYFRRADYSYNNIDEDLNQNYFGGGLNYNFSKTWQLNFSGELSTFGEEQNYRFYTRLTKRFYSKNKR
jgi:hypothetical protein